MSDPQECRPDGIDEIFSEWDRSGSPGAAVVVVQDGDIVCARGYGCAQMEYGIPITPSTVFHVASVSKQFTAAAVALLAHEGKLSLDDDIRSYLPDIPDFGHTITVRHLVHHTSGLRDQWELLQLAGWRMDDVITEDHILKMVHRQQKLNFVPGDEHMYSNTGYTLLARIVSEVSGLSFRKFTDANLFQPLGMCSTHFHDDHLEIVQNRAYSYGITEDGNLQKNVLNYANVGATSLFTTAEDLARWLHNLDTALVGDPELIDQLHERFTLNNGEDIPYAFGLTHSHHRGLEVVGHGGADAGFRSYCGRFPAFGLGIIVLSNLARFNPQRIAMQVAELYLEDEMSGRPEAAQREPGLLLDRKRMRACTGRYLLGPMGCVQVLERDGGLALRLGEQPPAELRPRGGLTFQVEPLGARLEFDLYGEKAERFVLHTSGHSLEAERYHPHEVPPAYLEELAGRYYSPELETSYTVTPQGDKLALQHSRHTDAELLPLSDSTFQSLGARPGRVEFTCKEDEITGFTITGSRVRRISFDRM